MLYWELFKPYIWRNLAEFRSIKRNSALYKSISVYENIITFTRKISNYYYFLCKLL